MKITLKQGKQFKFRTEGNISAKVQKQWNNINTEWHQKQTPTLKRAYS